MVSSTRTVLKAPSIETILFLTIEMRKGNKWHSVYEEAINSFFVSYYFTLLLEKQNILFILFCMKLYRQ